MATVTQAQLTCDVCSDTKNIKTRTFELDGKAYVIDLCRKDGNALDRVQVVHGEGPQGHRQTG